jgi:hypothetical protein
MELCCEYNFTELGENSLCLIEGGTFWGVVSGVAEVIAGAAAVVGGAALFVVPEPTTLTKIAGVGSIAVGVAGIGSGIATISNNT